MTSGRLYLIPAELDADGMNAIPSYVHDITAELDIFFTENERTARRYLRKTGYKKHFDAVAMWRLDKDTTTADLQEGLQTILAGKDAGMLSEAGLPCIADPGAILVRWAHQHNIQVVPLSGPSSLIMALMASGLNGQQFTFHGYLPVPSTERIAAIKQLEKQAAKGYTQLCIETPYRNQSLLDDILRHAHEQTMLGIAYGLTGPNELVRTLSVSEWKRYVPKLEKIPAVFMLGTR
jgi:16S rRNA (cytidine1402-2'-O)-methyltransferase